MVVVAIVLGCGGSPPPATPPPEPQIYPNPAPPDPCPDRVDVAMACFDLGVPADADCAQIVTAKGAELASRPPPCDASLRATCADSCGAAKAGETRDHYYMLMTSPPPARPTSPP